MVEVQFRPQKDIQLTSKPPRIHWNNGKLDPSLLNNQNWFRESQDMVFCMPVKATIITCLAEILSWVFLIRFLSSKRLGSTFPGCSSILEGLEVDWITSSGVFLDLNSGIPKFC